jgi:DNA-binding XRE family transcriptional regulator
MTRTNIEAERGRMQMTKGQMCDALGVTLKTYNGYIDGNPIPSTVLEKLRNMTGKSVDYLLGLIA